jgi:hypothetical protein
VLPPQVGGALTTYGIGSRFGGAEAERAKQLADYPCQKLCHILEPGKVGFIASKKI